jgi:hypothetical protein
MTKSSILWDMAPYSSMEIRQRFRGTCRRHVYVWRTIHSRNLQERKALLARLHFDFTFAKRALIYKITAFSSTYSYRRVVVSPNFPVIICTYSNLFPVPSAGPVHYTKHNPTYGHEECAELFGTAYTYCCLCRTAPFNWTWRRGEFDKKKVDNGVVSASPPSPCLWYSFNLLLLFCCFLSFISFHLFSTSSFFPFFPPLP